MLPSTYICARKIRRISLNQKHKVKHGLRAKREAKNQDFRWTKKTRWSISSARSAEKIVIDFSHCEVQRNSCCLSKRISGSMWFNQTEDQKLFLEWWFNENNAVVCLVIHFEAVLYLWLGWFNENNAAICLVVHFKAVLYLWFNENGGSTKNHTYICARSAHPDGNMPFKCGRP